MENDTLYGFRIRMALFVQAVNEMIATQLAEEESGREQSVLRLAMADVSVRKNRSDFE